MTIGQIAEMAGVSKATVSRVLNNKPDVNPETRDKIMSIIEQNKFTPNAFAKAMSSNKSNTIGLIIPYEAEYIFSNPFYVEVLRGISTLVNEYGYYLNICYPKDHNYVDYYIQKRVDGFVLMSPGSKHANIINDLMDAHAPFIATSSIPEYEDKIVSIDVDNFKAGYTLTDYLLGLGHKHIAYIGKTTLTSSINRLKGFRSALSDNKVSFDEALIRTAEHATIKEGYEMTTDLLNQKEPPTAIFLSSDIMALGALNAARDLGMSVPKDISIVGFDDIPIAQYLSPSLTTIYQPAYEKGYKAAEVFVNFLSSGTQMTSQILDTKLVVRNSTAAPPR